jgi:hypothetical protein
VEYFAGSARLCISALGRGVNAAAFDIAYHPSHDAHRSYGYRRWLLAHCCIPSGALNLTSDFSEGSPSSDYWIRFHLPLDHIVFAAPLLAFQIQVCAQVGRGS